MICIYVGINVITTPNHKPWCYISFNLIIAYYTPLERLCLSGNKLFQNNISFINPYMY